MLFKNVKYVHSFGKKRLSLNFWSYWEQEEHNFTIAEIKKSEEKHHYQTPRRGSSIVTLARLGSKWARASQRNARFGVKTDYSYFHPRFSARWFLHVVVSHTEGLILDCSWNFSKQRSPGAPPAVTALVGDKQEAGTSLTPMTWQVY